MLHNERLDHRPGRLDEIDIAKDEHISAIVLRARQTVMQCYVENIGIWYALVNANHVYGVQLPGRAASSQSLVLIDLGGLGADVCLEGNGHTDIAHLLAILSVLPWTNTDICGVSFIMEL